ncbi:MAG: FkbM family methyltransferase [bacterium]|nr:FkbM family methyltransferase [bacterium]
MSIISNLRKFYRKYIHINAMDKIIYGVLDNMVNLYCIVRRYHFPAKYIRRWKLDFLGDLYEKETMVLVKKIMRPGMTIVDIGAHIGYFTRAFSKSTGSAGVVYAFEADPENFEVLEKNTNFMSNVRRYPTAISDHVGKIDFYHCEEKAGCNSTLPNLPLDYKMKKISVYATDLDTALEQAGVKHVDLIKIDIEGGEVTALKGMKKTLEQKDISLIIEFAPAWIVAAGVTPQGFLSELASLGFNLFAIMNDGLIKLNPNDNSYVELLPKTETAFNEFLNIYCVKGDGVE